MMNRGKYLGMRAAHLAIIDTVRQTLRQTLRQTDTQTERQTDRDGHLPLYLAN